MKNLRSFSITLLLTLFINTSLLAAPLPPFHFGPHSDRLWLGGDGIYSVILSENKTLWLFGDSFVDKGPEPSRKHAQLIANSLAISEVTSQSQKISYYWKQKSQDQVNAFFETDLVSGKLWPQASVLWDSKLYITALEVIPSHDDLGFSLQSTLWIEVTNPHDSPKDWVVTYGVLHASNTLWPTSSLVIEGEHLYFFSTLNNKQRSTVLLRTSLQSIGNPQDNLEYLHRGGDWKRYGEASYDFKKIIPSSVNEMSVFFHPAIERWLLVRNSETFASSSVVYQTARDLMGPWSRPHFLFEYPEMKSSDSKNHFCYAAKAHPFRGGALTITYACNSLNFNDLLHSNDLYWPRLVQIPLLELDFDN